jgi:hypothetical protein
VTPPSIPPNLRRQVAKDAGHRCGYCLSDEVLMFNPRSQDWHAHFTWNEDKTHIIGLTSTGRATVMALQLNRPILVKARWRWVMAGIRPMNELWVLYGRFPFTLPFSILLRKLVESLNR